MELLEYIKKNYKTPNVAVLRTLGASEELIEYLTNTPWNTNMKIVESLISGGDDAGKQGLKSITISPSITTTPALADISPTYYDGERTSIHISAELELNAEYAITVTPTSDWYVYTDDGNGEIGEAYSFALTTDEGGTITAGGNFGVSSHDDSEYIEVSFAS